MSSKKNKKQPAIANKPTEQVSAPVANSRPAHYDAAAANEAAAPLKEESLRWIFSIIGALIVYWVVATIIQSVYHPDINALLKAANEMSFTGSARPEPMEAMLFRTGVVTTVLGTLIFYILFSKTNIVKPLARSQFFLFFVTLCTVAIVGMIYMDFAAANPFAAGGTEQVQNSRDLVGKTNFGFYFDGIFLGSYILVYTFLLVPLISCIFYLGIKKYNWESNQLFNRVVTILSYVVLGGTVLALMMMNTYDFPYAYENKYDFNAVYYSVTQVCAGLPLLAHGFTNTYGLYPHFINLILHFTGLSIVKFTFVMSIIIGATFIMNFFALRKFVNNKIIWLLGCCAVVFLPYLDFRILTPFDSAFAYPIRYFVPGLLTFLVALYLNKRSQIIYWTTFLAMGFSILWNPELGLVSFLSWLAFNIYNDFYTAEGKMDIKKILMHVVAGAGSVAVAFGLYKALIYMFYGVSPEIGMMFTFIAHFGSAGFNLLPMVLVHPWNISALTIIVGFSYAVIKWYNKAITPKASIVFLLSIISLGFFVYFQGRSHNWNLVLSSGYTFFLLTVLGDELWQAIKDKGNEVLPLHMLFVVFLFLISFSFFELVFDVKKISDLTGQEDLKDQQQEEQKRLTANQDFIVNHSGEHEKVFVLTAPQYQGLYFDGKRQSAFNPGQMDMVMNTDLVRWEDRIIDSSFNAFVEPALANFPFYMRPLAAFAATYTVKADNHALYMLTKRKTKVPGKTFFAQDDIVVHKKYTDDTAGIKARINDALGANTITVNPVFSLEVLFHTDSQMYPYASLVGNMDDSSGFIMANIIGTANYFFGINGKGVAVPLAASDWVYCVMNAYPDHLEIYQNGVLAGAFPIAGPIRQSRQKIEFGNAGFLRYYVGAIAEIAIHNKALDKAQVQQTWDNIKPELVK